jgi:hypothetical protein
VRRRSSIVAALLVASGVAGSGSAVAAGGGGVQVGATVPAEIALALGSPSAFAKTSRTGVYRLSVTARVTSTAAFTMLSITDGEDLSGPAHGHLHDGGRIVAAPLEAGIAGRPAQSLAGVEDPVLATWTAPLAQKPATVALEQTLPRGTAAGPALQKVLLVTVSTTTP